VEAIVASQRKEEKVGMERVEVGPLVLTDTICEEIMCPREVVIRLAYVFCSIIFQRRYKLYYLNRSAPLFILEDDADAKKIANFCKKKYDHDLSFLFYKKLDKLFEGVMDKYNIPADVEQKGKDALKTNPESDDAQTYTRSCVKKELYGAAIQFFKIIVIAYFVDITDGKSVHDAFEKLMVMMACLASIMPRSQYFLP
jgi:hypothetical protein